MTRYAEQKKAQERENKKEMKRNKEGSDSSDDEEPDKRRRAVGMGKVFFAPEFKFCPQVQISRDFVKVAISFQNSKLALNFKFRAKIQN